MPHLGGNGIKWPWLSGLSKPSACGIFAYTRNHALLAPFSHLRLSRSPRIILSDISSSFAPQIRGESLRKRRHERAVSSRAVSSSLVVSSASCTPRIDICLFLFLPHVLFTTLLGTSTNTYARQCLNESPRLEASAISQGRQAATATTIRSFRRLFLCPSTAFQSYSRARSRNVSTPEYQITASH